MLALFLSLCDSPEDAHKLDDIFKKYYELMYRITYKMVQHRENARDLVQDATVKVIENGTILTLQNERSIRAYLIASARNTATDYLRAKGKQTMVDIDEVYAYLDTQITTDALQEEFITKERYKEMIQCIRTLPDTLKEACYLRYICGFDDRAIASALHITYANAAMRVHRGRALLQKKIAEVQGNEKQI